MDERDGRVFRELELEWAAGDHELVPGERRRNADGDEFRRTRNRRQRRILCNGRRMCGQRFCREGLRRGCFLVLLRSFRFGLGCFSRLARMQAFWMLIQKLFSNLAEPVVKLASVDSLPTQVFRVRQSARPAVDDDLLPAGELLLVHGV